MPKSLDWSKAKTPSRHRDWSRLLDRREQTIRLASMLPSTGLARKKVQARISDEESNRRQAFANAKQHATKAKVSLPKFSWDEPVAQALNSGTGPKP